MEKEKFADLKLSSELSEEELNFAIKDKERLIKKIIEDIPYSKKYPFPNQ